jgi:hypothetical protein
MGFKYQVETHGIVANLGMMKSLPAFGESADVTLMPQAPCTSTCSIPANRFQYQYHKVAFIV